MKFDFTTLLVRRDVIEDYREAAEPAARDYHCIAAPSHELYPYAEIDSSVTEPREMAQRMVACINACVGLALPEDLPPGTLADAVKALEEIGTILAGHPESNRGNSKVHFAMHRAKGVLATLNPATVSP